MHDVLLTFRQKSVVLAAVNFYGKHVKQITLVLDSLDELINCRILRILKVNVHNILPLVSKHLVTEVQAMNCVLLFECFEKHVNIFFC